MGPELKTDKELVEAGGGGGPRGAHIEMMRRLKDSIGKLDKNAAKYGKAGLIFSLVLLFVALVQLLVAVVPNTLSSVAAIVLISFVAGVIVWIFHWAEKNFFNN